MDFESILVSKGLPHAESSQNDVIDAHRSITSHNDVRHLASAPSVLQGGSSDACVYTRESVCREAASFKSASGKSNIGRTESGNIVTGVFTPVLAKHSKSFSLVDCISLGVDRRQRNFEPMRKQVGAWQKSELTDVTATVWRSVDGRSSRTISNLRKNLDWITKKDAALRQFTRLFFCITLACASIAVAQPAYTVPFLRPACDGPTP